MAASPPTPGAPSTATVQRRLTALRIALAAAAVATLATLALTGSVPSADRVRELGDDLGGLAPFLWPPLLGALNLVVPWPILAGATGLVFGTAAGTALAVAGVLVATALQFGIARHAAGERLRARVLARVPRIDALLARSGFLAAFYSRIVPGVSWGMVNYAAGLARVRLRDLLLATALAGSPKVFAYVALGGSFDDLSAPEAKVAVGLWVALALTGLVLARRGLSPRSPTT